MKRILLITICTFLACTKVFSQEKEKKNKTEKVTFLVENISCHNCIRKIEKNIAFEKGVTDMKCDLDTKIVEVTYRKDKTDTEKLVAAFKKIDYIATVVPKAEEKKK
jgi:Cu2+-exporting ATPase